MRLIPRKRGLAIGVFGLLTFLVGTVVGVAAGYAMHARTQYGLALACFAQAAGLINEKKDDEAAIPLLYYAEAFAPDWYVPYIELGFLYERRGFDKLAVRHLQRALDLLDKLPSGNVAGTFDGECRRQVEERLAVVRARLSAEEKTGGSQVPEGPGPAASLSAPTRDANEYSTE